MKAYINDEGCIMAVFKDRIGLYHVYYRKTANDDFRQAGSDSVTKSTREEAEEAMKQIAMRSNKWRWHEIDFKG